MKAIITTMKPLILEKSDNREPLLTTSVVSKWLGVSTRTLCLWAECKEIPAMKIGRQWRFRESEVSNWLHGPETGKVKYLMVPQAGSAHT
jgi:excisionase family DNA binding protein